MFASLSSSVLDDLLRLQQEVDDMLGDGFSLSGGIRSLPRGAFPAINVVQTPEQVQVYVFAPGLDPQKIDVQMQQGLLSISGQRQSPEREEVTYYRQERFSGEFRRAISLSEDIDPEKVQASYRDGILHISLQRQESAKPRRIEIR